MKSSGADDLAVDAMPITNSPTLPFGLPLMHRARPCCPGSSVRRISASTDEGGRCSCDGDRQFRTSSTTQRRSVSRGDGMVSGSRSTTQSRVLWRGQARDIGPAGYFVTYSGMDLVEPKAVADPLNFHCKVERVHARRVRDVVGIDVPWPSVSVRFASSVLATNSAVRAASGSMPRRQRSMSWAVARSSMPCLSA